MGDNLGASVVAVSTFPVALYVLLIFYLALVMVPFENMLDMLACPYVVKLSGAYVLLTLIIKSFKNCLIS
jgi:hypothetical protein